MNPPVTTGRPYVQHFGPGHGHGVHDFLMEELELGELVAMALNDEACGYGPLFDFMFACTTSINNVLSALFALPARAR